MITSVSYIKQLLNRVSISAFGTYFNIRVERDNKNPEDGRIFLQIQYDAPDTKTGEMGSWSGRKWYLSDHMTKDEIIKTAYAAFEMAVKHEVLEGFKIDGKSLFNPHVDFEALLTVSHIERGR